MRWIIFLFFATPFLAPAQTITTDFSWLEGKWNMKKKFRIYNEVWSSAGKNKWKAHSIMREGKRVLWTERGRIAQKNGNWYYFSQVSDQPKQGEIAFQLTSANNNTWVFENPEHDFPNRISYQRIGADSIFALVTGSLQGKPDTLRFPMRRIKP